MSIESTLAERGNRYGDFTDHAKIAQDLQDVMRRGVKMVDGGPIGVNPVPGWNALSPVQKQALTVIADKIARILSGDPNYADNWHDIQGYAKLAEDRLPVPDQIDATSNDSPGVELLPLTYDQLIDAPAWPSNEDYTWMAQDSDGSWFAYSIQPILHTGNYRRRRGASDSHMIDLEHVSAVVGDSWTRTCVERPF